MMRWLILILILTLACLAGCAPRVPAPVEDRSRATETEAETRPAGTGRVLMTPPANYEVRRGDTLYSIAFRFGLDWREVAGWNRIEAPYTIRPGQDLRLTEPPRAVARRGTSPAPEPSPSPPAEESRPADAKSDTPAEPERERDSAAETRAPAPSAAGNARTVGGVEWQWPTSGAIVRPFDASATRRGLGIGGDSGQPVLAAAGGEVVYSGTALIGYGELIIIKHSDTLLSAYGHNRVRLVEEGDRVGRGERIAEMGMNERDEELLHFEIRRNGQPVDPLGYLPSR